jgi:Mg2+ and Co2+ transporter CorA
VKIYINVDKLLSWKYNEEDESYNDLTFDQILSLIEYRKSLEELLTRSENSYLKQLIIEDIEWVNNKIHGNK